MIIDDFYFKKEGSDVEFHINMVIDGESHDDLYLMERLEKDIWSYNGNYIKFDFDNEYHIRINDIYNLVDVNELNIWDIYFYNPTTTQKEKIQINKDKEYIAGKSTAFNYQYGKLKFNFYKNASDGLSMRITYVPAIEFFAQIVEDKGDFLNLYISNYKKQLGDIYIARQSSSNSSQVNTVIMLTMDDNGICKFNKDTLSPYCQNSNEIWKFVYKIDNKLYEIKAKNNEDLKFKISDAFSGKLCSDSGIFKIIIYEGLNENYKKIKIANIGSCFSRNVFKSENFYNQDYKRFYECGFTVHHISISSLMSKKIEYDPNDLVGSKIRDLELYGKYNFDKNVFDDIKRYNPDYLVCDNYACVNNNLIETTDGAYIDPNYYLRDTEALKKINIKKIYRPYTNEFFEIYKEAIVRFREKIKEIIPLSKLILIKSQCALKKLENGQIEEWENQQFIKFKNFVQNRFDEYFIKIIPEARVINLRNEEYFSEKSPTTNCEPSHLGSKYYKDCLNEINKIVLQDLIKNQEK